MKKILYLFLLFSLSILASCYYDNFAELNPGAGLNQVCDTANAISYATQVVPIMQQQCSSGSTSCHSAGSSSGIDLSTHAGVEDAANNSLISSITWDGNASTMPKNSASKIDDCSIAIIQQWISEGKANN